MSADPMRWKPSTRCVGNIAAIIAALAGFCVTQILSGDQGGKADAPVDRSEHPPFSQGQLGSSPGGKARVPPRSREQETIRRLAARADFEAAFYDALEAVGPDRSRRVGLALQVGLMQDSALAFRLMQSLEVEDLASLPAGVMKLAVSKDPAKGLEILQPAIRLNQNVRSRVLIFTASASPSLVLKKLADADTAQFGEIDNGIQSALAYSDAYDNPQEVLENLASIQSLRWRTALAASIAKGLSRTSPPAARDALGFIADEKERERLSIELGLDSLPAIDP